MSPQYAARSDLAPGALASELRGVVKNEVPAMVEMSLRPMQVRFSSHRGTVSCSPVGCRRRLDRTVSISCRIYSVLAYSVGIRRPVDS